MDIHTTEIPGTTWIKQALLLKPLQIDRGTRAVLGTTVYELCRLIYDMGMHASRLEYEL